MKSLILSFIISATFFATPVLAQFTDLANVEPDATIKLDPSNPQPGGEAKATLNDFRSESYGSSIVWKINDVVVEGSYNRRSITFTAGEVGEAQTISVVLTRPSGNNETIKTVLYPIYLDLIIEPQTRVPDFYLGRSLPSIGSSVNATAILTAPKLLNTDLMYTWKLNQGMLEGGSVRGKNKISFSIPIGKDPILSLTVTNLDGIIVAKKSMRIPSVFPEIYFYEVNALFGISQKPILNGLNLIGNTTIIQAEPYNLDSRVYNDPDVKEWSISGTVSTNLDRNPYKVTLQKTEESGFVKLNFHVRDTTRQILQGAKKEIRINY